MNETQKQRFKVLAEENNLTKDHFFKAPQGYVIITRQGIERIQAYRGIRVKNDIVSLSDDLKYCVVKAYGEMTQKDGLPMLMETYGEASPENAKQKYKVAMAEKRALSRVVLKLSGLYEIGVYSEDESDDFKRA